MTLFDALMTTLSCRSGPFFNTTRLATIVLVCCPYLTVSKDGSASNLQRLPPALDGSEIRSVNYNSNALWADKNSSDEDDELAERLGRLEESYSDLKDAHDDLKDSLKEYAETGHSGATMSVNGRIHADMWGFPDSSPGVNGFESGDPNESVQDRVGFRRMRFGVKGNLPYNMVYKIEMEFAAGNSSEFRDCYLGWKELPGLQTVYLGNQKRPYGLDHLNSSRYNVFIERPWIVESFNQDCRRFGLVSYGLSDDQAWNWRYGLYNTRLIQDEGNYISDHWQSEFAGRIANTIWYDESSGGRGYAHWALSGSYVNTDENAGSGNFSGSGDNEARFRHRPEARTVSRWIDTGIIDGADDYGLLGTEGVINIGPFQVVGEYLNVWMDRTAASHLHFQGGYAYISYFLTGEHIPWVRKTGILGRVAPFQNFFLVDNCCGGVGGGWGAWQVALRYSYGDLSDNDIQGGVGESITFGVNWHWTKYARMQFNYIYGEVDENDLNAAAGAPNFGHYQILGARWMVDF